MLALVAPTASRADRPQTGRSWTRPAAHRLVEGDVKIAIHQEGRRVYRWLQTRA